MEHAVNRIIDANFNRAREAARVIEEYCRFALNCRPLTDRTKQIRHRLCALIDRFDDARLIASRDTAADVGAARTIGGQLERRDLRDCFKAGCKRLTEALRALAETTQTFDAETAAQFEKLRFEAYDLEKDITLFAEPAEKFKRVKLYVIITSDLPAEILALTAKCAAAGADCIQLRAKHLPDDNLYAVAEQFVKICADEGALSMINDRPDIAVASAADGIHLGQNDMPIEHVRKFQRKPLIIGKSTHCNEQLRSACADLPTYVALGPVFPTGTKPETPAVGLKYVAEATKKLAGTGIESVAVGGITLQNVADVLNAGSDAVAVCSAVTAAADPAEACRAMKNRIEDRR
ncbi:MAG: thiamine phosphate synthase [Sedimentisphaerales bacterium]|nr:thiamine phosphate synthase [Sedimentisphaerales bacterium]